MSICLIELKLFSLIQCINFFLENSKYFGTHHDAILYQEIMKSKQKSFAQEVSVFPWFAYVLQAAS